MHANVYMHIIIHNYCDNNAIYVSHGCQIFEYKTHTAISNNLRDDVTMNEMPIELMIRILLVPLCLL